MSPTPQTLQDYRVKRDAFIHDDRSLRRENVRLAALSVKEKQADEIIRRIRTVEETKVWKQDYADVPHPFPGMEFLTGKRIIEQTKLYGIIQKMPKGGLLHAHLDATVNVDLLMGLALQYPRIHVRVPRRLTTSTISNTLPELSPIPVTTFAGNFSVSHAEYQPDTWVSLSVARDGFDASLGGKEGFDKWIHDSMTINPAEAYGTHNTVTKIWQKFSSTFRIFNPLIRYRPILGQYIRQFFLTSIEDGISYVEPRVPFFHKVLFDEDGESVLTHRDLVLEFDRVLKEVKEEMKAKGRPDDFIGARIIYSTLRAVTAEELEWYTNDCIALKQEFPHLIAGFDLVGDENVLKPLTEYITPLLAFKERVKELGLDLPLILHAGETLGDGSMADDNLYDAILLGTKRIGHGFSLVKHPKLMEICREKGIALEICPISNEILRLTSSMPMHPLPILLNNGVPVALNSDDPAIFGNMGLSYDYYQVLVASDVNGLTTLGQFARDSITFSSLEEPEKERALKNWEERWDRFLDEVLAFDMASI